MRRITVISPDDAFGHQLAGALHAVAEAVEIFPSMEAAAAAEDAVLCVVHAPAGQLDVARIPLACPVIVVLPRSNLAALVEMMQASRRVIGAVMAEDFAPQALTAMATRVVRDDVFGIASLVAPLTELHSIVVSDYDDKVAGMAAVLRFAEQAGVPRKVRDPMEQCLDEMLMNALYDAPVDAQGKHIFAGVSTRDRVTMRSDQSVVVQYGFDGKRFALSVRDAFGSLERVTVLRHFDKGLHARDQVEGKAGGAGLGLYLMANTTTALYLHVLPGVATEAVCVFDVERPKLQLEDFAFLVQSDLAGRVRTAPARRRSANPLRAAMKIGAIVGAVLLAVAAVLVVPRLLRGPGTAHVAFTTVPPGAAIEIDGKVVGAVAELVAGRRYPVTARLDGYAPAQLEIEPHEGDNAVAVELQALPVVELDSTPTDATVELDGKALGSTPLTVTSLQPGARVTLTFARPGYRVATAVVEVPPLGKRTRLVQPLAVSDDVVKVHVVSTPPGAEIRQAGQRVDGDRTYTPADLFLEVDHPHQLTLTMPRHVPLVLEPFTPRRGEQGLEKGGTLIDGAVLHVEAKGPGTVTVERAPHCVALDVPADCTLAPGSYQVTYTSHDGKTEVRTAAIAGRDAMLSF